MTMKTRKQKSKMTGQVDTDPTNGIYNDENHLVPKKSRDEIPANMELEMVSNSFRDISFGLNTSNKPISLMEKKKQFGKPVIISSDLKEIAPIPIPKVLRANKKSRVSQNDSLLSNFFTKPKGKKMMASITIGTPIKPDQVNSGKKNVESPDIAMNDSIIEGEVSISSVYLNDKSQTLGTGPLPHFYSLRNKVICVMEPQCKFSFHGKLKIKVLYGGVNIYGTTVGKSNTVTPIKVYSPRSNSVVEIQATTLEKCSDNLPSIWSALKIDNIDCNISNALQSDINNVREGWAVITMQNFENNLTTFLDTNSNYKLFPKIEDVSNYSWFDMKRAEIILQTNIYCNNLSKQRIDFSNMDEVIDKILIKMTNTESSKVIVAGGKSVGKSTTMRYLINKTLEKYDGVIVLDLDPGQAEFTPPGCISLNVVKNPLFGPNFTHLKMPYYQLYIGGVDVTRCLSNYINGIKNLVQRMNAFSNTKKLPVIVNTMGFCRGIGWDIMTSIIKCIQPTDIIQIVSARSKNNFDQFLSHEIINRQLHTWTAWENCSESNGTSSAVEYELHIVNSQAEIKIASGETWNIEPHQQREIVMLAYLSEITQTQMESDSYDDDIKMNINGIIPYQVPFSAVKLSLGHCATPQILSIMNGNIVALCGDDTDNIQEESIEKNLPSYPEVLIRLPLSTCYGFGILRGVDMEKEKIYINTPLSISELKRVNCLIGCMPVPSGLLQLNRIGVPYTGGGDCNLPTNRDPRRGYFRMKYRSDT